MLIVFTFTFAKRRIQGNIQSLRRCSILTVVVCLQKCETSRSVLREASAVDVLPRFRSVADAETKCVVNLVLAYIVTEEENDKIDEVDDNIAFVINMLRQVNKTPETTLRSSVMSPLTIDRTRQSDSQ